MRTALYARVSTEEQVQGYSIDAQLRACRGFAEEKSWQITAEYVDEGRSARTDDISRRPQFKRMVDDAQKNLIDVVVVHKLDRFSRNLRVTFEYLDLLDRQRVGFVSVSEQMDFSTPMGKVVLANLAAFAQFYSDNLSVETKKGWAERRAQGLYCGLLPFGAMKGEDGIPVPDMREITFERPAERLCKTTNFDGLLLAFQEAANGSADGAIARILNDVGYRTAGNQGSNPFSKDTVRGILINRFYLGELPVRENGRVVAWIRGKHNPFIDEELWQHAREARERNRRMPHMHPRKGSTSAFTGIARCWYCQGRYHVGATKGGRRRLMCYNRVQRRADCPARSAPSEVYEQQIGLYLRTFHLPENYQEIIMAEHKRLQEAYDDTEEQRGRLLARLERLKSLFVWGDLRESKYLAEKREIGRQLHAFTVHDDHSEILERLAVFLRDLSQAWERANPEQRNRLLRQLLDEVWFRDDRVVAVRPRVDFEPFFKLSFEEWLKQQHEQFESAESIPIGVAIHLARSPAPAPSFRRLSLNHPAPDFPLETDRARIGE